jgi:hypothetical protein
MFSWFAHFARFAGLARGAFFALHARLSIALVARAACAIVTPIAIWPIAIAAFTGAFAGGIFTIALRLILFRPLTIIAAIGFTFIDVIITGFIHVTVKALFALVGLDGRLHGAKDTKIVISVLEIAFRHDPIARALRVAGQLQVSLINVMGRATNLHIRAVAFKGAVGLV